jgi:class 3 adenylate cyclase
MLVADLFMAYDPRFLPLVNATIAVQILIPASILISIFRFDLFDIDRLISATASYSILSVLALTGILALVPRLGEAAGTASGIEPFSAQLMLSVVLAAVIVPTHQILRPRIDRMFFPERSSLERGTQQLLAGLSAQRGPRELTAMAGEQLEALLRPESTVVYARTGSGFEPVFVRGRAVPPGFDGDSPLAHTLENRTSPLASGRSSRRDRMEQLSNIDRAALETLGAVLVAPLRCRGQLAAFLCLGAKRSGDIYTATDLTLLTAVANAVSTQLDRFEDAEVIGHARAMQETLRRYVPEAVAQGLEAGKDLEPRQRSVSVLFVDIRGYTAYAESRPAHELFSTINRFTIAVSTIVRKFGGSVVEFNGDGMMAVFGAPRPLPKKEQAAVAAGREIVAAVHSLPGAGDASDRISVGVGIATGSAYVGSIQSADRLIWTALGNTTNLAARLQGMTRELDAAVVMDLATQRAAGDPAADAELRTQIPIRGRSLREDVYVLPAVAAEEAGRWEALRVEPEEVGTLEALRSPTRRLAPDE